MPAARPPHPLRSHPARSSPLLRVWRQEPLSGEADALEGLIRRKTSTASFFANSDSEKSEEDEEEEGEPTDELAAYLALPQIKMKTERDTTDWWQEHAKDFPNVAVMARQYLGCPASSAAVERLFSQVGIAYAAKRKSASADTLEDIMFARIICRKLAVYAVRPP